MSWWEDYHSPRTPIASQNLSDAHWCQGLSSFLRCMRINMNKWAFPWDCYKKDRAEAWVILRFDRWCFMSLRAQLMFEMFTAWARWVLYAVLHNFPPSRRAPRLLRWSVASLSHQPHVGGKFVSPAWQNAKSLLGLWAAMCFLWPQDGLFKAKYAHESFSNLLHQRLDISFSSLSEPLLIVEYLPSLGSLFSPGPSPPVPNATAYLHLPVQTDLQLKKHQIRLKFCSLAIVPNQLERAHHQSMESHLLQLPASSSPLHLWPQKPGNGIETEHASPACHGFSAGWCFLTSTSLSKSLQLVFHCLWMIL